MAVKKVPHPVEYVESMANPVSNASILSNVILLTDSNAQHNLRGQLAIHV